MPPDGDGSYRQNARAIASRRSREMDDDGYDSDGVRERRSASSEEAQVAHAKARARRAWDAKARDVTTCFANVAAWTQTTTTVEISIALPRMTTIKDFKVEIRDENFTLWTSWSGEVKTLSGALARRVKASESTWTFDRASGELNVILAKGDSEHVFQSLFENGQGAKSHVEVLKDFVHADEPYLGSADMDVETKALLEEMKARHAGLIAGKYSAEDDTDFKISLSFNQGA